VLTTAGIALHRCTAWSSATHTRRRAGSFVDERDNNAEPPRSMTQAEGEQRAKSAWGSHGIRYPRHRLPSLLFCSLARPVPEPFRRRRERRPFFCLLRDFLGVFRSPRCCKLEEALPIYNISGLYGNENSEPYGCRRCSSPFSYRPTMGTFTETAWDR